MRVIFTATVFCLFSSITSAQNIVHKPAPAGLLSLAHSRQLPANHNFTRGAHGLKTRCFHGTNYLILSKNIVGKGYKLTSKKPKEPKCVVIKNERNHPENELGITLGLEKKKVLKLLNIKSVLNGEKIIYQSKVNKNGTLFDRQTSVELNFIEGKLSKFSVFTTVTY